MKNFTTKIQKLGNKLDFWRSRNLTLLGRTLIFKCLGLPQLVYPASILETPQPQCSSLITTYMFNFLWNNKPDKIKREIMYLDYADGGLRVPKINTMFIALKLAWIPRLLRDFDCNSEAWRVIPDAHLKRYGGLNFLLRCNYDRKCLDQGAIPSFYKEILVYFAELKKIHCYDVGQDLILFNNSKIKIEGNTVFYKDWMNKGVFAIHDLLHETTGKFLSYQEFTKKYKVNCNFLTYFQVLSAIPKDLLEKARHYCFDKQHFDQTNSMFQLSSSISLNLMKTKCRDFYWLLNKSDVKATGLVKWEKDFQFADVEWKNYFNLVKLLCKETKLREFYYKLLHKIINTKRELFFYGVANDQACSLCSKADSIYHTFVDCSISRLFYNQVIEWLNNENAPSLPLSPSPFEILFGIVDSSRALDSKVRKINYALLLAKYYIYCQKLKEKELNFTEFKQLCLYRFKVEDID